MEEVYQEVKGGVLCRLYFHRVFDGSLLKVFAPFNKKVYYVKGEEEMHGICEELFKKGYFEGEHYDTYTDHVTSSVYARSVVYWLTRQGLPDEGQDRLLKERVIETYLFPLLERCECSNRTKEVYLLELARYLSGEVTAKELVTYFTKRVIPVTKKPTIRKVKIA